MNTREQNDGINNYSIHPSRENRISDHSMSMNNRPQRSQSDFRSQRQESARAQESFRAPQMNRQLAYNSPQTRMNNSPRMNMMPQQSRPQSFNRGSAGRRSR